MADRLFKGQIRPAAQPIGSFINPARFNTPNAANRPSIAGLADRHDSAGGTTNVAGFNQADQIAKSLGAFNRELKRWPTQAWSFTPRTKSTRATTKS